MGKRKYKMLSSEGIDEKLYVNINDCKEYLLIRGEDISNPIILDLHGGPGNPDSSLLYNFIHELYKRFTYVCWDQRGCKRTYYENLKTKDICQITLKIFISGEYDKTYPMEMVKTFVDSITAPSISFHVIKSNGHSPSTYKSYRNSKYNIKRYKIILYVKKTHISQGIKMLMCGCIGYNTKVSSIYILA